ncbi:hypothetical protein D9M71_796600 [compost metagenome]
MTKYFDNLQPHVTYEFSLSVRRRNFLAPVPSLSLRAGSMAVTEHTFFPHMSWKPLSGTFVATQPRMQLWVESHSFSYDGNDFDIDDVRLREL